MQRYFPGLDSDASGFAELRPFPSQYTIRFMALYIPHRCPKCFESIVLIQPQHKGGAFKGPAKSRCLSCKDEQEYDLRVPANRRDLIHVLETVEPKAETLT